MARVSIGQAGANALGAWLQSQLLAPIKVRTRWPEASVRLQTTTVTIVPIGRRQRLDVEQATVFINRVNLTGSTEGPPTPQAQIDIRLGSYIQPAQIDVWATNADSLDDVIDRLDDALTAPTYLTCPLVAPLPTDDPVRDGILLPLRAVDNYTGFVEAWFDEPELILDPDSIQRSEYRASYYGEIRGDFTRRKIVTRAVKLTQKIQVYDTSIAPPLASLPYATTSFTVNQSPPPTVKISRGFSSS